MVHSPNENLNRPPRPPLIHLTEHGPDTVILDAVPGAIIDLARIYPNSMPGTSG